MSNKNITIKELLKSKGLLFPSNADEVIEFEKLNNIEEENPKDWDNPLNIILRGKQKIQNIKQNTISSSELQNLAMAAREGSTITDEVRKKMNEDRNNAKNK
jgi:hypothetical protein